MRCLSIVLLSAVVFASSGCMYCENGLCSPGEPEAFFDPVLLGEWDWINPNPQEGGDGRFKVERDDPASKAYRVSSMPLDNSGKPDPESLVIRAYLTKSGDSLFLDTILPPEPGRKREGPSHFLWRVEIKKSEMTLQPLSEKFVKDHPDAIRRTVVKTSYPLGIEAVMVTITATTRELGDFVREHARDDAAWDEPHGVLRHR